MGASFVVLSATLEAAISDGILRARCDDTITVGDNM